MPAGAITSTCTVQLPLAPAPLLARAGTVPPFMVTELLPATAVMLPAPQEVTALAGVATRIWPVPPLVGKESEIDALVIGCADRLVRVMVSRVMLPSDSGPAGENALATVSTGRSSVPLGVELVPLMVPVLPG